MEIFEPIRKRMSVVGIAPYQKYPLNSKNIITLFMLIMGALLNCVHLLHEADTFKEYADSFCASASMIVAAIVFVILIWETLSVYRLLDSLERSTTKRELKRFECLKSTFLSKNPFSQDLIINHPKNSTIVSTKMSIKWIKLLVF